MDIGAVLSMMFPMLGMNVFLIYGMRTEGNQAGTYVYSGIFLGCYVGNVFSFVDYDFQAIREETKKGTSGLRKKNAYRRYLNKKSMQIKSNMKKLIKYYKAVIMCGQVC